MFLWLLAVTAAVPILGALAQDYDLDSRSQNKWWTDYASLDDYDDDQLDRRMNLIITKNILPGDFPLPLDERLFFRRTSSEEYDDFAPQPPPRTKNINLQPPPRRTQAPPPRPVSTPRPVTVRQETPRARIVPAVSRRPLFQPRTTLPPPTSAEEAEFDSAEEDLEDQTQSPPPQQQGRAFNPSPSVEPISPNVLSGSQNIFVTGGPESPKSFNGAPNNRVPNSIGKRPVGPNSFTVSTPASRPFVPTTSPPRTFNTSPSPQKRPFVQSTPRPAGPFFSSPQPQRPFSVSPTSQQRPFSASQPPREFIPSSTPQIRTSFQATPPPRPVAPSTPVPRPFHPSNIAPRPFHVNASQPPQLTRFEGSTSAQPGRPLGPPPANSFSLIPVARNPTSAQPTSETQPPPRRTQVLKRRLRPSSPPPQQDVSFSSEELEDDIPRSTHGEPLRVSTGRPQTQPQPQPDVRLTPTLSVSQPSRRPVVIEQSRRPVQGSPPPRDQPFRATTFRPSLRPDLQSVDGRSFLPPPQSNQIPQRRRRPVVITSPRPQTLDPSSQRSPEVEVRGRVRVPFTTANPLQPTLSAGAAPNTEIIPPAALREVRPRVRTGERTSTRFQRDETRRRNALLAAASSSPAGVAMPDGTVEFVPDVDDLILLSKLSALQDNALPKSQLAIRFLVNDKNGSDPSSHKSGEAPCDHQGRDFCPFTDHYPSDHVNRFISEHGAQLTAMFEQVRAAQAPPQADDQTSTIDNNDNNSQFVCETEVSTVRPGWARDVATGHWVVVINTQKYNQKLRVESCRRRDEACLFITPYYRSSCVEHQSIQRLVSVNPAHPEAGPQIALVSVPCGCSCRVGTPGQQHHQQQHQHHGRTIDLEAQS